MFYKKITPHFLLLLSLLGWQSNASPTSITYTTIGACVEQVENDNAAFSRLQCPSVAGFALNITQQSPQYFTVLLNNNGAVAASELATYSHELPMEPGQAIEWHVVDGVLHLCRAHPVPGNVDHIVHPTDNAVHTIGIAAATVSGKIFVFEGREIHLLTTFV